MAIISYGFLPLKSTKSLDLAILVQLTMSSKQGKKLLKSALSFILKANKPHNCISGGGIVLVTCVVRLFLKNFFAGSDSSDTLSSDRSCHFGGTCQILRENNGQEPMVSSQIIWSPLNRRKVPKLFNLNEYLCSYRNIMI